MVALQVAFWACFLLVAHTYLLYPLFLFAAASASQLRRDWHYLTRRRDRRRIPSEPLDPPQVTLIIPAFNEERHLPDKLANLRELDYPKDALDIVFVSDGSTDRTQAILRDAEGGNIRVIYLPERGGKANAINHAVASARHGLLVLSDAATLFAPDAVKKLVRHFTDPRVGVICGALQFQANAESQQTEGVYWRYESMLRLMESRLGVTLNASGAIYAIRRACFVPIPADTLVEDLVVPLEARRRGFRVGYDPEATAVDFAPTTVGGEFTRRVRIATGSFRALGQIFGTPLDALTAFAFLSHKLLRWLLPFFLAGMLATSVALAVSPLYRTVLIAQLTFYAFGLIGFLFRRRLRGIRYVLVPYYLLAMHLAFLVGFIRFLARPGTTEWRRVP
jgi:cellulose synthase/poly-beta-1,6-N-acetylglucosamine synthase-like glycosyltransferase